jgi:hypothetical protein
MSRPCSITSKAENKGARRIRIFAILLLALPASGWAEPPVSSPSPAQATAPTIELEVREASARESEKEIQVGDRLTLQAELKGTPIEPGEKLVLKPLDEKAFQDSGWFLDSSSLNQGGSVRFIASPLKGGDLVFPALSISDESGKLLAKTRPSSFKVKGFELVQEEEPKLLDVISISLPKRYLVFGFLLFLSIAFLLWGLWKRFQAARRAIPSPPLAPIRVELDHERAIRRLEELFDGHPFDPDTLKPLSFGISEILKEFFSKRFHVDALESTTDEMLNLLRREALTLEQLRAIQLLFTELDHFKFLKTSDYPRVTEETRTNLKIKATLIIQKWALQPKVEGGAL